MDLTTRISGILRIIFRSLWLSLAARYSSRLPNQPSRVTLENYNDWGNLKSIDSTKKVTKRETKRVSLGNHSSNQIYKIETLRSIYSHKTFLTSLIFM